MSLTFDKIDRIDMTTKHAELEKELPCRATPEELAIAPKQLVKSKRSLDAEEAEFKKVRLAWKARIQVRKDELDALYRLIEEEEKLGPVLCYEHWGWANGERVLILRRADGTTELTEENFVSMRFPQPEDRQANMPGTEDKQAAKHGEYAFADDEEENVVIPFRGAIEPADDGVDDDGDDKGQSKGQSKSKGKGKARRGSRRVA